LERLARRRETIDPLALLADCARPASRRLLFASSKRHKNNECGLPPPEGRIGPGRMPSGAPPSGGFPRAGRAPRKTTIETY
jgi:hypothetical protein